LKISLAAEFEVVDPAIAINKNANYHQAFYLTLQMAIRQFVGGQKAEALIESRTSMSEKIAEMTREKIAALGLHLISAEVKDVMLPGELRRTFAQIVKAQKEGQAAVERARGETAALRSLANAAKMAEDNPNLLQLRALQMMSESSGNTIMLGVAGGVPVRNGGARTSRHRSEEGE
jgi:regulator of protease activity HflC (stomatin/prohibitin superfamily)